MFKQSQPVDLVSKASSKAEVLREEPEGAKEPQREPLAIVGIGCRFPGGASDPESFWKILRDGLDAVTEIPPDRWNVHKFYDPEPGTPGKTNARWGGFVEGIDRFDAQFFGISPREAARMDPQQRLLLEVSWEALEDGGQALERLSGSNTGVFVGLSSQDYMLLQQGGDLSSIDAHTNTGGAMSIVANRVSYCLNLRGPSIALDTACSSSLVAVHEACKSLWHGECRVALAGGVNVLIKPEPYIGFSRLSMLSADGRCKAFDASANGFVRSEGAAMVVIKKLSQALADGDDVYALIRSSAVNQDGHTSGLTVPSEAAQEELVRTACKSAGVLPAHVQFVEAHGPGTLVGDPIEAAALGAVLGENRPEGSYCKLGSVKTNIGHLEPAAGIAGLVKVALALKKGLIPPNLHFQKPNPAIPFEKLRLRVQQTLEPWSEEYGPVLAGVNSFGFGGTNAHTVLERYAPAGPREIRRANGETSFGEARPHVLTLSARSPAALTAAARDLRSHLGPDGRGAEASLHDVCWTASTRRTHHDQRLAIVARTREEMLGQLGAFSEGQPAAGVVSGRFVSAQAPRLVFVCSGQGPQWWAMGRQLSSSEPEFRRVIEECDAIVRELGPWSLLDELNAEESASRMQETSISQPAIFALQIALAQLWKSWGIEPDAVVGHSVGEVAAVYLAGALSLRDAVRTIYHRGRCMDFADARGRMLAVGLPASEAAELVRGREDKISLAANNGPNSVTLSGDGATLEQVASELEGRSVFCKFLRVDYAFHSPQMDPMRDELLEALRDLRPRHASRPLYSTVSGKRIDGTELTADYWWQNVRQCVRFADAIDGLMEEGYDTYLELAPHPVLSSSVSEVAQHRRAKVTLATSLRRGEDEQSTMLKALGQLYCVGRPVDWSGVLAKAGHFTRLPLYAWQRESHWNEDESSREFRIGAPPHPLLGKRRPTSLPTWESHVDLRVVHFLEDHRVQGSVLLSGTSYIEMILAAAREHFGAGSYVLEEVELLKACFLADAEPTTLQLVLDPEDSTFGIHSRPKDPEQPWTTHVRGKVRAYQPKSAPALFDVDATRARCAEREWSHEECYARMAEMGLDYGPAFRGVETLWSGAGEAVGRIRIPDGMQATLGSFQAHPAILDACFQVLTGALPSGSRFGVESSTVYLPVEYGRVRVLGRVVGPLWGHARVVSRGDRSVVAEVRIYDEALELVLEVQGFRCQAIEDARDGSAEAANDLVYEYEWHLAPRPGTASTGRSARDLAGPTRICQSTAPEAARLAQDLGLAERFGRLVADVNALCTDFMIHAFSELGVELSEGERFTTDELSARLGADPRYWRLMHRYLEMLEEDGLVQRQGAGWEVVRAPRAVDPAEVWRSLLNRNPAFYAELTLLGRCGQQLAGILRGDVDPLHLIFPDGSLSIAEHLYQDSPSLRFYNTLVQRAIAALVESLPEGRTLRVLEVGAGTGGMSSYVLPKLPADRTTYVYTDLSNHFFLKAEEKFKDFPFLEFKRLDIEQDPVAQGFEAASFDLILASECLHATADLRQTLTNVNELLASDGLLLLLEAVEPVRWVDLVFGLTEGWWRFTDQDLRPSYPLLTFAKWKALLEEFGYDDVREASGRDQVENAVIVARGPRREASEPIPAAETADAAWTAGNWLILADDGGSGRRLAEQLGARGQRCVEVFRGSARQRLDEHRFEIDASSRDDVTWLFAEARAAGLAPIRGIVHMWNLDAPALEAADVASLDANMVTGCLSGVHMAQALSEVDAQGVPRLWIVTRGAQSVGREPESTRAAQASAWGLGRVIINEVPKLRTAMVDLDPAGDESLESFCDELLLDGEEDEIALRGGARYVHRYVRTSDREDSHDARRVVRSRGVSFRLETTRQGVLDRLVLRETRRTEPGPGQVEVEVAASGLNFADVMKALGLYPGLGDGPVPLGIECSGRISAVGPHVEGLRPGDPVIAIAPFAFGSYVTTGARFLARKPEHIGFEEAATLPIAYLTAHYALNYLGRMRRGESVLIHSATGGVGLAAIQLARMVGAEVLATAGTPEKRDFLRSLGVVHVMDSRSLEFGDEVLEATGGRGVDLVLNSLAGEAIRKGLGVLADYGRFLEIGKRDIYGNSRLGLRPFKKNLSFMAVDLDGVMRQRPDLLAELFQELMQHFADGSLSPLPYRVFPASNAAGAFRYMAQAKHIGKVVLSLQEPEIAVAPPSVGPMSFRDDATYLMTGGLGGFGLTVAQWMVENGARHLVLMGRSGAATPEAEEALGALRRAGANVVVAKADVTDRAQVSRVLSDIEDSMPPLRGVLHAAMVLKDRLLMDLNHERMHEVWSPKVNGAWNLHSLTASLPLDFFVLFSSLSSVFGIGGQANYASANAFMDSLAYYRKSKGLPAVTVSWGYLGEVGWVARHGDIAERLETQGVRSFSPRQALTLLGRFLQTDTNHVGVMNIDWRKWGEAAGSSSISPRFADLVRAGSAGTDALQARTGSASRKLLLAAEPAERRQLLETMLREQVARVLGASAEKLDIDRPLTDLGLDSLMAVELRNWIEGDLRLSLPTVELMKGPSVSRLADLLLAQLAKIDAGGATSTVAEIRRQPEEMAANVQTQELLAQVDEMSDEQVEAMLREMASEEKEATGS